MALIHHTASEGSPEKSAGSAALSCVALVDIGVTGGAGGTGGCLVGAGGTALCLGVLWVWEFKVEGTMVEGVWEEGCSSSSLVSGLFSP